MAANLLGCEPRNRLEAATYQSSKNYDWER
jgi:hypothetical protein